MLLNSGRGDQVPSDEQRQRVRSAQAAVQQRPAAPDQSDVIQEAPEALKGHMDQLAATTGAGFFNEGWRVALVDLSKVCAVQPSIFTQSAVARVEGVDPADLGQLASVTLPIASPQGESIQVQRDESGKQWLIASRNPNLQVMGYFSGPIQQGAPPAFGFPVGIPPAFVQAVCYQGRWLLRDGYHRSFGLLSLGARYVPAFVRDMNAIRDVVPNPGLLPNEAFLGPRPPTLLDYSDDAVAAATQLPSATKIVIVQAFEAGLVG